MDDYDIVIVRPYVSLPNEAGAVDRYFTLHEYAKKSSIKSLLCISNFHHNTKKFRNSDECYIDDVEILDAGSYKSNLSLSRLLYEIKFSLKAYKLISKLNPRAVIIGEPIFAAWLFFFLMKIKKGTLLYGDFIDLMPEAYMIKFRFKWVFWFLLAPLFLSRWLRANVVYDKTFTVSEAYSARILSIEKKNGGVFYWGSNEVHLSKACPIKPKKIVYAGSLGEGYDIETIIELGRIRPDLKIVVAGLGPKKNQCQLAHDMGIIQYLGQISPNDLMQLYGDACIGLLPYSKNSAVSMPIKFFEYLAYELKIVNSLSMECSEIIINNSLGANYIPGDVNSLSKAVDRAINLTQDKNVIRKLNEIFSVKTQYKNFIDAIKKEINLI